MGASDTFGRARRATAAGAAPRIGIDLGGTKIEAIALGEGNAELFRQRAPTPASYEETLRSIAALVTAAEASTGPAASVGVGAPGSLSPVSGKWRNANIEFCNGRDLPGDLAASLGRPVTVENDANCFALSEAIDGAGAGAWSVYGLTAGTGLGGGMVVGGILNRGRNASAGEAGHNPLPWLRRGGLSAAALLLRAGRMRRAISFRHRRFARFSRPNRERALSRPDHRDGGGGRGRCGGGGGAAA